MKKTYKNRAVAAFCSYEKRHFFFLLLLSGFHKVNDIKYCDSNLGTQYPFLNLQCTLEQIYMFPFQLCYY